MQPSTRCNSACKCPSKVEPWTDSSDIRLIRALIAAINGKDKQIDLECFKRDFINCSRESRISLNFHFKNCVDTYLTNGEIELKKRIEMAYLAGLALPAALDMEMRHHGNLETYYGKIRGFNSNNPEIPSYGNVEIEIEMDIVTSSENSSIDASPPHQQDLDDVPLGNHVASPRPLDTPTPPSTKSLTANNSNGDSPGRPEASPNFNGTCSETRSASSSSPPRTSSPVAVSISDDVHSGASANHQDLDGDSPSNRLAFSTPSRAMTPAPAATSSSMVSHQDLTSSEKGSEISKPRSSTPARPPATSSATVITSDEVPLESLSAHQDLQVAFPGNCSIPSGPPSPTPPVTSSIMVSRQDLNATSLGKRLDISTPRSGTPTPPDTSSATVIISDEVPLGSPRIHQALQVAFSGNYSIPSRQPASSTPPATSSFMVNQQDLTSFGKGLDTSTPRSCTPTRPPAMSSATIVTSDEVPLGSPWIHQDLQTPFPGNYSIPSRPHAPTPPATSSATVIISDEVPLGSPRIHQNVEDVPPRHCSVPSRPPASTPSATSSVLIQNDQAVDQNDVILLDQEETTEKKKREATEKYIEEIYENYAPNPALPMTIEDAPELSHPEVDRNPHTLLNPQFAQFARDRLRTLEKSRMKKKKVSEKPAVPLQNTCPEQSSAQQPSAHLIIPGLAIPLYQNSNSGQLISIKPYIHPLQNHSDQPTSDPGNMQRQLLNRDLFPSRGKPAPYSIADILESAGLSTSRKAVPNDARLGGRAFKRAPSSEVLAPNGPLGHRVVSGGVIRDGHPRDALAPNFAPEERCAPEGRGSGDASAPPISIPKQFAPIPLEPNSRKRTGQELSANPKRVYESPSDSHFRTPKTNSYDFLHRLSEFFKELGDPVSMAFRDKFVHLAGKKADELEAKKLTYQKVAEYLENSFNTISSKATRSIEEDASFDLKTFLKEFKLLIGFYHSSHRPAFVNLARTIEEELEKLENERKVVSTEIICNGFSFIFFTFGLI